MEKIIEKKIYNLLKKLKSTGFFHIFISQILNKVISFASTILVVRLISKSNYGLYSYANNIISMFLLFNGLGAISGLMQFGCENINNNYKMKSYSQYALKIGMIFSSLTSLLIFLYAFYADTKLKNASIILLIMCLIPVVDYICSYIQINFRIRLQNSTYSLITTINSIFLLFTTIFGAYLFSVIGIVIFRYLAYAGTILVGIYFRKKNGHFKSGAILLTKQEKKSFLKLSLISCVNNGTTQMLYLLDVFIIGIVIPNLEIIASYKTATTIPFVMTFIPSVLIMYIYPYFAMNNHDRDWIKVNYNKLLKIFILMNAVISGLMFILAPLIIRIVFGAEYMDSLIPFRILSIGYFISATFRIPSGNILVSLHRININLYNGLISGALNIILNFIMIKQWGSIGAAYATLSIYIISSLISTIYLNKIINDKGKPLIAD